MDRLSKRIKTDYFLWGIAFVGTFALGSITTLAIMPEPKVTLHSGEWFATIVSEYDRMSFAYFGLGPHNPKSAMPYITVEGSVKWEIVGDCSIPCRK